MEGKLTYDRTLDPVTGDTILVPRYWLKDARNVWAEVTLAAYLAACPEGTGERVSLAGKGYPIKSVALAVDPSDAAEANEFARERGLAARYDEEGRCVLPDAGARRELMKAEERPGSTGRLHDRDSYYGH